MGLFSVCGCSTLIGADFDREPYPIGGDDVVDGVGGLSGTGAVPGSGGGFETGGSGIGGFATGVGGSSSVGGSGVGGSGVGGSGTGGVASGGGDTGGSASGGSGTGGSDSPLRLNEVYPNGPDYIEVVNISNTETSLAGFRIVKGDLATGAYSPLVDIPAGTVVAGGGFYVFEVNNDFIIDNETTYYLVDASDAEVDHVDYPTFPPSFGYARMPDGYGDWFQHSGTKGTKNDPLGAN